MARAASSTLPRLLTMWSTRSGRSPGRSRRGGRRHLDDGQTVVEVGAELAGCRPRSRRLRLVAAMSRTSTGTWLVGADAPHLAPLEHAQQLGLQVDGQLADLVQEHRAAVGGLEHALARRHRAGEGAALVTEQLALEQAAAASRRSRRPRTACRARRLPRWIASAETSLPVPVSPSSRMVASLDDRLAEHVEHAAAWLAERPTIRPKRSSAVCARARIGRRARGSTTDRECGSRALWTASHGSGHRLLRPESLTRPGRHSYAALRLQSAGYALLPAATAAAPSRPGWGWVTT